MGIRGSVAAVAITTVFILGYGTLSIGAQEAALSAAPELAARGVWNASTAYIKDDIVTARGSTWIARRNNTNKVPGQTNPSTALDWRLFARGFNPTGAWSSATTYQPDDLVTQNGQTYRAKLTNASRPVSNTTNWELLAAKGAAGPTGATGPQGPAGPNTGIGQGSAGVPSISFNGDPSTGIYSPSDGKIALVSNGDLFLHNLGPNNTALGLYALKDNTTGSHNVALGGFALHLSTTGGHNTAIGSNALAGNTSGTDNTAVGNSALGGVLPMTGVGNTALGKRALFKNGSGDNNIAVGTNAGANPTFSNDSIFIGNSGVIDDSATIKIGTQGTQTTAFMAGIAGVNAGDVPVYVDSTTGQLGIGPAPSSRRFKYDIETMADMSALLSRLHPVTFRYNQPRSDGSHPLQYGLIAEEVAELIPDLALFDKEGRPNGVKYHLLPSFLLAGYQAQQKTIAAQAGEIAELKQRLAAIEAALPRMMKAAAR